MWLLRRVVGGGDEQRYKNGIRMEKRCMKGRGETLTQRLDQ